MTNEEFYDRVLVKARRVGDTSLRAVIFDEMEELLSFWEHGPFHPWFLEKTSSGLVTVAEDQTISLPSDFLIQVENTKVYLIDDEDEQFPLKRGYHEDLEDKFANEDSDQPWSYDIFADEMWFGPIPDEIYTIRMKYYRRTTTPPDDTDDVDNPWILNAQDLCVTAVAQRLTEYYLKDEARATKLMATVTSLRGDLHKFSEARKHVDMDYEIDR